MASGIPAKVRRRKASLVTRMVIGACASSAVHNSLTRRSSSSRTTISVARPAASASSAENIRAVKMRVFVRAGPMSARRRAQFSMERQFPKVRAMGIPNFASGVQMRKSLTAAMLRPPPDGVAVDHGDGRLAYRFQPPDDALHPLLVGDAVLARR